MGYPSGIGTFDPYTDPRVTPASKHVEPQASPSAKGKPVGGTDNPRAEQKSLDGKDKPQPGSGSRHRPGSKGFDEFDGLSVKK
jgi:hypothetical protein